MSNAYPSGSKKHELGKGMERSPEQPESYVLRGGQAGAGALTTHHPGQVAHDRATAGHGRLASRNAIT
jgi:hypothetical protein